MINVIKQVFQLRKGSEFMANVHCSSSVSFSVSDVEKDILQKAHDIMETIRHSWFLKDDDAWDNEEYWGIDSTVKLLERLFECKKGKN